MSSQPRRPHHLQQHHNPSNNLAYDVAEALRNPYAQSSTNQSHNAYTHYMTAYMQSHHALNTTPEGYTLSSTYNPMIQGTSLYEKGQSNRGRASSQSSRTNSAYPSSRHYSWYQRGDFRCTYLQCKFTGSAKSVEIHKMDRHLLYPRGRDNKKGSEWDADPSLKGKTIPIQGTSIVLNSPEALDAWIAERRKRWPTAKRVKEKKVKLEEAIARGQIPLVSNSCGKKRRREEGQDRESRDKRFHRSDNHQAKLPKYQALDDPKAKDSRIPGLKPLSLLPREKLNTGVGTGLQILECNSTDSDEDGAPEVVSSKLPSDQLEFESVPHVDTGDSQTRVSASSSPQAIDQVFTRPRRREPKPPPRNPFASRPTLLRNLILPEIRMTISNLSQAIRFLVDNDFLRDVELRPDQAGQNIIEVVGSPGSSSVETPEPR